MFNEPSPFVSLPPAAAASPVLTHHPLFLTSSLFVYLSLPAGHQTLQSCTGSQFHLNVIPSQKIRMMKAQLHLISLLNSVYLWLRSKLCQTVICFQWTYLSMLETLQFVEFCYDRTVWSQQENVSMYLHNICHLKKEASAYLGTSLSQILIKCLWLLPSMVKRKKTKTKHKYCSV